MSTVDAVKQRMIDGGGRTAQTFGLNRLLGQIYMLLFMCDEPCSLDEIAGELGMSKASVSIACRQLQSLGVLRRVWKKGDRRDYYEAETDLRRVLDNSLLDSIGRSVESARSQIREGLAALKNGDHQDGKQARLLRERLAEAEGYCNRITSVLKNPIIRKLL